MHQFEIACGMQAVAFREIATVIFPFSHRKTTQVLNFFARKSGGEINKLKALKLVYFADRYHLRRFGRPITGDEYLAMPFGPVASGAKDLTEMSEFLSDEERAYAAQFLVPIDRYTFRSSAEVAEKTFSKSDRMAMEWAWETFGEMERFKLADYTHRYPEWKRHEAALEGKRETRVPMNWLDFLEDPDNETDPCHPLSAQDRAALVVGIQERFQAESMLS